jgi:6-phosphogluconolactonase
MVTLRRFDDLNGVESAAYELLAGEAAKPETTALLLSGGSTPFGLYGRIAKRPFAVSETCHVALSDERMVPFDSPESNVGRMLGMLKALRLPAKRVLCAAPEDTAETAAWRYNATLKRFFADGGRLPVALLGLGEDGHTAGLFTAEDAARGKGQMAIPVRRPDGVEGVTVTRELLVKAGRIVFLVAGPAKLDAVKWLCAGRKTLVAGIVAADHPQAEVWYTEQEPPETVAGARKRKGKEGEGNMTAKCGAKASHKGHLCVLASELKFDQIKELVTNPKFMCFNCGRVADSKKNLCNPMLLKD